MRELLRKNRMVYKLYITIYNLLGGNKIQKGKKKDNNRVVLGNTKLRHCRIRIKGKNNFVKTGFSSLLKGCEIIINGDNCKVMIGERSTLLNAELVCEDTGSSIETGDHCICAGKVHFAATEGKRIVIGDDFLCSDGVTIRTGDSHSIYGEDKRRINPGKDVKISKHVWIGNQVILLKGTELGENDVVGSGSVVRGYFPDNVVITGNPAKIIRENISWDFQR